MKKFLILFALMLTWGCGEDASSSKIEFEDSNIKIEEEGRAHKFACNDHYIEKQTNDSFVTKTYNYFVDVEINIDPETVPEIRALLCDYRNLSSELCPEGATCEHIGWEPESTCLYTNPYISDGVIYVQCGSKQEVDYLNPELDSHDYTSGYLYESVYIYF